MSKPSARELLANPKDHALLAARVENVLARHIRVPQFRTKPEDRGLCWECGKPYPCPTINDLNGEES